MEEAAALNRFLPLRSPSAETIVLLAGEKSHAFFLDSGQGFGRLGERSFFGWDPFLVLQAKGRSITLTQRKTSRRFEADPFEVLEQLLNEHSTYRHRSDAPLPGAAVGYLAYDLYDLLEELPKTTVDDLGLPDLYLAFYGPVAAADHVKETCFVPGSMQEDFARHRGVSTAAEQVAVSAPDSNLSFNEYVRLVERAKEYIAAGDIYQVNLAQRFCADYRGDGAQLYLRLRRASPAPFAAFLKFPDFSILSSSPERFLHLDPESRLVETRPIKGTRPRGTTPELDEHLARELLDSEKDYAENVMIVDLERNDLGRVCEIGSVRTVEIAALERFPTVFHLTSTVRGRLAKGRSRVDLLRATFPGGSITGAPKLRAMEIIDELEPHARGVYTGAIGYFGFDGSMDLNIAIRTLVLHQARAYYHVGGGIVADSTPEAEYQETLDKGKALWEALTTM